MSASATQLWRPGEKRDRLLGTTLMIASVLQLAWQLVPATRHILDFGAVASPGGWWAWLYGGWRLRNSYGTDNSEAVKFRTPETRRKAAAFFFALGVIGLIAGYFVQAHGL